MKVLVEERIVNIDSDGVIDYGEKSIYISEDEELCLLDEGVNYDENLVPVTDDSDLEESQGGTYYRVKMLPPEKVEEYSKVIQDYNNLENLF